MKKNPVHRASRIDSEPITVPDSFDLSSIGSRWFARRTKGSEKIAFECTQYNVFVRLSDTMPKKLHGFITPFRDKYLVVMNGTMGHNAQIHTMRHEIAHVRLGHLNDKTYKEKSWEDMEKEVNVFLKQKGGQEA